MLQVLLVAPSFLQTRLYRGGVERWCCTQRLVCKTGAPFGVGWALAGFIPSWHVCFTCSSSGRNVQLRFSGFTYRKGWCLLHHIEVNGKVLLMLVPRGIWDRAGHFKGTASLFWWFSSPTQNPCVRTRSRGSGRVWWWKSLLFPLLKCTHL